MPAQHFCNANENSCRCGSERDLWCQCKTSRRAKAQVRPRQPFPSWEPTDTKTFGGCQLSLCNSCLWSIVLQVLSYSACVSDWKTTRCTRLNTRIEQSGLTTIILRNTGPTWLLLRWLTGLPTTHSKRIIEPHNPCVPVLKSAFYHEKTTIIPSSRAGDIAARMPENSVEFRDNHIDYGRAMTAAAPDTCFASKVRDSLLNNVLMSNSHSPARLGTPTYSGQYMKKTSSTHILR